MAGEGNDLKDSTGMGRSRRPNRTVAFPDELVKFRHQVPDAKIYFVMMAIVRGNSEEACYNSGSQNVFWVTGFLNPKSSEFISRVSICFGVYLSHGIVHRVATLFSSKISF